MTGKELMIYILQNNLEDEQVIDDDKLLGFLTAEEAAAKMHVGPATIRVSIEQKLIPGYKLNAGIYIPANIFGRDLVWAK